MYRQNKLKEELDKLRRENRKLELENVYLNQRNQVLESEIQNMRLYNQLMNLCSKPRIIKLDGGGFDGSWAESEEGKQKIKEMKEMLNEEGKGITFDIKDLILDISNRKDN